VTRTRFYETLNRILGAGGSSYEAISSMADFFRQYETSCRTDGIELPESQWDLFEQYVALVVAQTASPHQFEVYHQRLRQPIDYYQLGLDFWRHLVDLPRSRLLGQQWVDQIEQQRAQGDNVILLANHQAEADPQFVSLLLEKQWPQLAKSLIFIAGHRVVTDPVAIPFSLGCDLLCIYSRRHMGHPPELREQKQRHNQKAIATLVQLLREGGRIVYVAPAGGRDRPNEKGEVQVAPFDPDAIAMMELVAHQARRPTHLYPLALSTYHLLPPPPTVEKELGEVRRCQHGPIGVAFGPPLALDQLGAGLARPQRREKVAQAAWEAVASLYNQLKMEIR
jgi:glycerol-3-phosphate O-acyltransferase